MRVLSHLGTLDVGQDAGLVENGTPNIELANVVRQACRAEL
jgi:hypothetical protein